MLRLALGLDGLAGLPSWLNLPVKFTFWPKALPQQH
ncbi:hypothetical protein ALON55S_03666 [Alishewanella longhuensis]